MKKIAIATLSILAGCVTTEPITLADGGKGHVVGCSGAGLYGTYVASWGQCYQKAGELCGARGYEVLERVGEQGVVASAGQYGASASTTANRMMIVRCKGPEPVSKPKAQAAAR